MPVATSGDGAILARAAATHVSHMSVCARGGQKQAKSVDHHENSRI